MSINNYGLSPTDPMRSIVYRIVYVQGHGAVMITVYSVKTMKDNITRHVCIWETNCNSWYVLRTVIIINSFTIHTLTTN